MDQPAPAQRPRLTRRRSLLVLTTMAWLLLSSCVESRLGCTEPDQSGAFTASRPTALALLVEVLSGRGGVDPRSVAERLSPDQLAEALDLLAVEAAAGRLDPRSLNLPHWLAPQDVRHVVQQAVHLVAPVAAPASSCPTCRPPDATEIEALAARAGLLGLPKTQQQVIQAGTLLSP